jgi:hypothetical protein
MTDSGEPFGQLPVPNLEERARLFLRAVHGERDFISEQRVEAQSAILDAMAAHIASKSNLGITGEPWANPRRPAIEFGDHPVANQFMDASIGAYQPRSMDVTQESFRALPAIEERQEPQRPNAPQRYAARIPREDKPSATAPRTLARIAAPVPRARKNGSLRSSTAPTQKPAKRRALIWGTAVSSVAGLCLLGGLVLYHHQMALRSDFVTAQSAAEDTPEAGRRFPQLGVIAAGRPAADAQFESSSYPTALSTVPQLKSERSRAALIERARMVIAVGEIEAVRIALNKMVESGNASAAVDLGTTYDPNILDALGVRNFPADVGKARLWYQRAQQMGAPEAVGLLESLQSSQPTDKP